MSRKRPTCVPSPPREAADLGAKLALLSSRGDGQPRPGEGGEPNSRPRGPPPSRNLLYADPNVTLCLSPYT
jgi:hypothetical protein